MNAPAVEVPVRVPWAGPVTRAAVRVSPSGSVSLPSGPGAAMVSGVPSVVV